MDMSFLFFGLLIIALVVLPIIITNRKKRNTPGGRPLQSGSYIPYTPQNTTPLSVGQYVGYQLLFAIPVVGLVCLIIFSTDSSNINRRNFARSILCIYAIAIVTFLVATLLFGQAMKALFNF